MCTANAHPRPRRRGMRARCTALLATAAAACLSGCQSASYSASPSEARPNGLSCILVGLFDGAAREHGSAGPRDTLSGRPDYYSPR